MEKLQLADQSLSIIASVATIVVLLHIYQAAMRYKTLFDIKAGKPTKAVTDLGLAVIRYKNLQARLERWEHKVPASDIALLNEHGQRALVLHGQAEKGASVDVRKLEKATAALTGCCDELHELYDDLKRDELLKALADLTAAFKQFKQ